MTVGPHSTLHLLEGFLPREMIKLSPARTNAMGTPHIPHHENRATSRSQRTFCVTPRSWPLSLDSGPNQCACSSAGTPLAVHKLADANVRSGADSATVRYMAGTAGSKFPIERRYCALLPASSCGVDSAAWCTVTCPVYPSSSSAAMIFGKSIPPLSHSGIWSNDTSPQHQVFMTDCPAGLRRWFWK